MPWNPDRVLPHFLAQQFRAVRSDDFPGVVVPLGEHPARRASAVAHADKLGEKLEKPSSSGDEETGARKSGEAYDARTIEGLRAEIDADLAAFGVSSAYDRKSKVINKAIADMGMGRYQWQLFVLCGFGWFADNFWLQGVALTLPSLKTEFNIQNNYERFTTLSLFLGLCIGASFWGIASDIIGRRLAFNTTLFIGAVFGTAVGGSTNWISVCALFACLGLGVGGNLPVDGALFLEFLPFASANLLTLLSVWWPLGSLVASMIGWGLIPNFSCNPPPGQGCSPSENMGWRYFTYTLGGITFLQWIARFIFFQMFESPKFLLSRGRQTEAVAVIHGLAYKNKTTTWLTEEILNEIGGDPETGETTKLSVGEIVKRSLSKFSTQRIGPLFAEWKLGLTTGLLWFQWLTIGMAYPLFNAFLPQYLAQAGNNGNTSTETTYRDYAITTVVGVPGSLLAAWTVDLPYLGRKGTMAIATMITGIFVFLFTASADNDFQLAFSSLVSFFQNIMYGVLYAYTPEVFPAPNRGTGTGIGSFLNRLGGLMAPIIGIFAAQANPKAPIYACGGLFLAAFVSMIALPIETRKRQAL